jgi:hypothetical protein
MDRTAVKPGRDATMRRRWAAPGVETERTDAGEWFELGNEDWTERARPGAERARSDGSVRCLVGGRCACVGGRWRGCDARSGESSQRHPARAITLGVAHTEPHPPVHVQFWGASADRQSPKSNGVCRPWAGSAGSIGQRIPRRGAVHRCGRKLVWNNACLGGNAGAVVAAVCVDRRD